MPPISYVAAVVVLAIATGSGAVLVSIFGAPRTSGRYATIDGLRGYLALFVFLHHSSIWFFFAHEGRWEVPPSNLFTQFGQGGVALFFMITGFLFFSKLLDARGKALDWTRLYVSRVLRLVPLYLFAMAVMFAIVGRLSGWTLREPLPRLLKGLATWLGFTFAGAPDLNGVEGTLIIVAGVTWSLVYEWLFYLSLPILGIATRVRPSVPYLLLSLAVALAVGAVMVTTGWKPGIFVVGFFGGGMTAALLVRSARFCAFARNPIASVAVIASLGLLVALYPSAYGYVPVLLLTFAFSLIAAGSSLFGLLTTPMSRVLGDISYSVYLLHGIFLFVLFRGVIGSERASGLQPAAHWTVIALLTPLLVAGCYATYRLVERPAMDSTPRLLGRLRSPVEPPIEEGAGVRPLG